MFHRQWKETVMAQWELMGEICHRLSLWCTEIEKSDVRGTWRKFSLQAFLKADHSFPGDGFKSRNMKVVTGTTY